LIPLKDSSFCPCNNFNGIFQAAYDGSTPGLLEKWAAAAIDLAGNCVSSMAGGSIFAGGRAARLPKPA
jgi:hypothetical protein